MASKKETFEFDKKLAARQDGVAAERDKLDDAISEMETLRENCDTAWDCLQDARDALSQLV